MFDKPLMIQIQIFNEELTLLTKVSTTYQLHVGERNVKNPYSIQATKAAYPLK